MKITYLLPFPSGMSLWAALVTCSLPSSPHSWHQRAGPDNLSRAPITTTWFRLGSKYAEYTYTLFPFADCQESFRTLVGGSSPGHLSPRPPWVWVLGNFDVTVVTFGVAGLVSISCSDFTWSLGSIGAYMWPPFSARQRSKVKNVYAPTTMYIHRWTLLISQAQEPLSFAFSHSPTYSIYIRFYTFVAISSRGRWRPSISRSQSSATIWLLPHCSTRIPPTLNQKYVRREILNGHAPTIISQPRFSYSNNIAHYMLTWFWWMNEKIQY